MNTKPHFPPSELIINEDGSIFHLHLKPDQLADKVILVGDPERVNLVASHFEQKECDVKNREFHTITGTTHDGKRISVVSTGIGCDNIDIVLNERHVRRTPTQHTGRHLHLLGNLHRSGRPAQLLRRKKRRF